MKAFTERNPKRIGLVAIVLMASVVAGVLLLNRSLFSSTYPVKARFVDAAGVAAGTPVVVAGVPVGSVGSVVLDGNSVIATLDVNDGTVLPHDTTAAVRVETLLGVEDVALQPVAGWDRPLRGGALITDTSVPVQTYQLQNIAGHLLSKTDAKALNQVVEDVAAITKGKETQVKQIIDGLGALTTTITQRSGEVSQLIDSADTVSTTLNAQDQNLVSVIDNLNTVTGGLAANSTNLGNLIDNVDQMATQTSSLLGTDSPQLDSLLKNLRTVLGVVDQHQNDLAEGVAYLGSSIKGFASVGYSGAADTPNSWANIYVNPVTTASAYGVIGPCGAFDQALDLALGPDPLGCSAQTGPLPGASSTGSGDAAPSSGTTTSAPAGSGTSNSSAAGAPGPDSGVNGLSQLLDPLVGGT